MAYYAKCFGLGKLEALNFLDASNENIRQWILQEGLKNTVPGNASALMCAEKGKLDIELHEKIISGKIFDSAGSIILALLYEGAYQTMDEYEYAGQVLMRYTHHAKTHCQTFSQFFILTQIHEYLQYDEETWEDRFSSNWKPHEKRTVEENIKEIAQNPLWLQEAMEILQNDQENGEKALAVAIFYEADIADIVFEKLKNHPDDVQYYYALFAAKDPQIIERLIGITRSFGDFNELTQDQKVVVISLIEELEEYNGIGLEFIGQALKTADGHLQYLAIQTLHSFDRANWQGTEIGQLVGRYAKEAKDPDVKEIAKQLLAINE